MRSKKEFSKCCKKCGLVWDKEMSNKYKGRALCKPCAKIEYSEYRKAYKDTLDSSETKLAKMQPFKEENRMEHWKKINKEIKGLKKLEDIRAFISKRADEVFADKALMKYINHQSIK